MPDMTIPSVAYQSEHRFLLPTGILGLSAWTEDDRVYAACMDGIYAARGHDEAIQRLYEHDSYASRVVLCHQGEWLISAGYDGQLIWYDLRSSSIFRRVRAHGFWTWDLALSPDQRQIASVTGQYLAGAEDYSPLAERERSVKIHDVISGDLIQTFAHVPPVQSVAWSPDGQHVAAANLMGEVRVWHVPSGQLVNSWRTEDFTSWGIIKSHCFLGGIFALMFNDTGTSLFAAGMGPMRDPMAGNGRQLWQRFAWRDAPAKKEDELHAGEGGEGLMEALTWHPTQSAFLMAGRLRGGDWNAALFDAQTGARRHHLQTGFRVSSARFSHDGNRLLLAGMKRQPNREKGAFGPFGILERFAIPAEKTAS